MKAIILAAAILVAAPAGALGQVFDMREYDQLMRDNDRFLRESQRQIDGFGRQRRMENERRRREAVEDAENRLRRLDDWRNTCTWEQVGCPSRNRGRW